MAQGEDVLTLFFMIPAACKGKARYTTPLERIAHAAGRIVISALTRRASTPLSRLKAKTATSLFGHILTPAPTTWRHQVCRQRAVHRARVLAAAADETTRAAGVISTLHNLAGTPIFQKLVLRLHFSIFQTPVMRQNFVDRG
jgi:hypothetical protein